MNDIIDRIDALVDEQMASGEQVSDYLTGDHNYPRCPHCGRHWHGLRLTERIATMYSIGRMNPEYTVGEDDSPVLCEGSDFIGPQRPRPGWSTSGGTTTWTLVGQTHRHVDLNIIISPDTMRRWGEMVTAATEYFEAVTQQILGGPIMAFYDNMFRRIGHFGPAQPATCPDTPDVDVKFGPENWIHEIQRMPSPALQFPRSWPAYRLMTPLQAAVHQHWHEFTAPGYPIPESPGYDFSHLVDEQAPTFGPGRHPFTRR